MLREVGSPTLVELLELTALIALKAPERHSRVASRWLQRWLGAFDDGRSTNHPGRGGTAGARRPTPLPRAVHASGHGRRRDYRSAAGRDAEDGGVRPGQRRSLRRRLAGLVRLRGHGSSEGRREL